MGVSGTSRVCERGQATGSTRVYTRFGDDDGCRGSVEKLQAPSRAWAKHTHTHTLALRCVLLRTSSRDCCCCYDDSMDWLRRRPVWMSVHWHFWEECTKVSSVSCQRKRARLLSVNNCSFSWLCTLCLISRGRVPKSVCSFVSAHSYIPSRRLYSLSPANSMRPLRL